MSSGLLYEPRSFWSIANVVASPTEAQLVQLDRRHFYNGGKYPIEIRRIALAGINYQLTGVPKADAVVSDQGWDQTSAIIQRSRVALSFPQRFHVSEKRTVLTSAMAAKPTGQPPLRASELVNSLWSQCNLDFDHKLILPRTASISWDLSAHTPWFAEPKGDGERENEPTFATMLYQEEGGLFAGSARSITVPLFTYSGNVTVFDPPEKWPYPPDGYGTPALPAINPSPNWWPPLSRFPAGGPNGFASFEATRSGSTAILGMRMHFNQRDYDEALAAGFAAEFGGVPPQASPLSLRMGCRVRTENGGTKEWWWRPGAPIALVFDAVTPALVYDLAEPFTMVPGEQVVVEMEIPASNNDPDDFANPPYHIGISLNGFAAIEG